MVSSIIRPKSNIYPTVQPKKNDAPAFHAGIHSLKNGDILYSRAMPLNANGTRPGSYWC